LSKIQFMSQELLDPISRLALHIFRTQQSLSSVGDDLTSPWGMTSAKWKVLGAVELSDAPPTASGIGRTMGMTRQAATKQIRMLVDHGLLIPRDNPLDARAAVYTLSTEGKATYDAISAAWAKRIKDIQASINHSDILAAMNLLAQLVADLERVKPIVTQHTTQKKLKGTKK
jgi:DNA-binding MarR family transcriptional regulator